MSFSKRFQVFQDESDHENYIYLDDFLNLPRKKDKDIESYNVKRSFKSYKGGIKTFYDKQSVSVVLVLKFIFSFCDKYDTCALLARDIEKEILSDKNSKEANTVNSSLDIYKLVANTNFPNLDLLFKKVNIDEANIRTLVADFKDLFTEEQWRKICWFENHFSKTLSNDNVDFEEIIRRKFQEFQSLLSLLECKDKWAIASKQQIKSKGFRIDAAGKINQCEIQAAQKHSPSVVESLLFSLLQDHFGERIETVAIFDTKESVLHNVVHAVLEINNINIGYSFDEVCQQLYYTLKSKHNVQLEEVYVFPSGCLSDYKIGDNVQRFHLRDNVLNGSVSEKCVTSWHARDLIDHEEIEYSDTKCSACYDPDLPKPLSPKGFDILEEWYLETPVETQILLDGFINRESFRRSLYPSEYLHKKFEKLYLVYDILLNAHNKHFIGVLQQANTQELLTEYRNISSVFDITSSAGATSSLGAAERKLKKRSDQDFCYFNTYLKRHNLIYDTITGEREKEISLRVCHLILLLDNLVKCTYKNTISTKRGDALTNQMCTLPITLQGFPEDSAITETWHTSDCDGTYNCLCKQSVVLTEADIDNVLINLSPDEQKTYHQFEDLMAWGYKQLWAKMTDEVLVHVEIGQPGANTNLVSITDMGETESEEESKGTVISSESTEDDLDLAQILQSVTDTIPKEDDDMLFRHDDDQRDDTVDTNHSGFDTCGESNAKDEQSDGENEQRSDLGQIQDIQRPVDIYLSNYEDEEMDPIGKLDKSFLNLSLQEDPEESLPCLLASFGFEKFVVPPLLSRHPPPATGRDDDIMKIKEIMDDVLTKMGYCNDEKKMSNRIFCGPDNKIGKCMLNLMESNKKYERFLVEFPLLHLRKSKITILFSAYSDAGLVQILQFMRDNDKTNWESLMTAQHIDTATRYIKRVSLSLHLAFTVVFTRTLDAKDLESFIYDLETLHPKDISDRWSKKFLKFLESGSNSNATFALHRDMMLHCDETIAIALAERLGGPDGYALMLASVKKSLPFSFVNGASSYAPYCAKLLHHHHSSGPFYRNLKKCLYATPFKSSNKNFACDTKRELDHLDAVKSFRSGSSVESATVRMSLIDSLNEIRSNRQDSKASTDQATDNLGWQLTEVDETHIFPTAALILRQNGLSLQKSDIPMNVYTRTTIALPITILDDYSNETGKYLMLRNIAKEKMFQLRGEQDIRSRLNFTGPSELVSRAKRSKGTTLRRTMKSKIVSFKTERQKKEEVRRKQVSKEIKKIECLSSENNACQALVKPDSSKPKVVKSLGMQRAVKDLLVECLNKLSETMAICIRADSLLQLNVSSLPTDISTKIKLCITEFAGVKFKTGNVRTGKEYLHHVESVVLKGITRLAPMVRTIVICEEKYGYTPDHFKAGTREQRQDKKDKSVDHLKTAESILGQNTFNKDALTKTNEGKKLISTYLARNINALSIDKNINLIMDSQLLESSCSCNNEVCTCSIFCIPLARKFGASQNTPAVQLNRVKQRKGEAEMAQLDWLLDLQTTLADGDVAISLVTSGDIDAIYIHMFVLCQFWERGQDNKYRYPVYVILQKPQSRLDVYNITGILEVFEQIYKDRLIGMKIAVALCIGGNDFVPKCYQWSHGTILKLALETEYRAQLLQCDDGNWKLNVDCFVEFMKTLYCPKRLRPYSVSFNEVRAATIRKTANQNEQGGYKTADPRRWLPPESAIRNLAEILQLQIAYLQTAGCHDAEMPNFLASSCLQKTSTGEVEYNFGPDSHFSSLQDLPFPRKVSSVLKRQQNTTPQRGQRRKRAMLTSTPKSKH